MGFILCVPFCKLLIFSCFPNRKSNILKRKCLELRRNIAWDHQNSELGPNKKNQLRQPSTVCLQTAYASAKSNWNKAPKAVCGVF